MGVHNAALLQKAGVATVEELARQNPRALHTTLRFQANADQKMPTSAMLKLWVRAAQEKTGR
jgi:predicted RecB family nuclease